MKVVRTKEDILFNCLTILNVAGFNIDNIEEDDLEDVFELSGTCNYQKCSCILDKGVCSDNHYIPVYKLINSFLKNVNLNTTKKQFLKDILLNTNNFKETKKMMGDIDIIYIKTLLNEKGIV